MQIPNVVTLPAKVYDILIGLEHNRPQLSKTYWNQGLFKRKEL